MSKDIYKSVTRYPVSEYHCGARAGDHVRLRRDLVVLRALIAARLRAMEKRTN